jgi:hypothetical protein
MMGPRLLLILLIVALHGVAEGRGIGRRADVDSGVPSEPALLEAWQLRSGVIPGSVEKALASGGSRTASSLTGFSGGISDFQEVDRADGSTTRTSCYDGLSGRELTGLLTAYDRWPPVIEEDRDGRFGLEQAEYDTALVSLSCRSVLDTSRFGTGLLAPGRSTTGSSNVCTRPTDTSFNLGSGWHEPTDPWGLYLRPEHVSGESFNKLWGKVKEDWRYLKWLASSTQSVTNYAQRRELLGTAGAISWHAWDALTGSMEAQVLSVGMPLTVKAPKVPKLSGISVAEEAAQAGTKLEAAVEGGAKVEGTFGGIGELKAWKGPTDYSHIKNPKDVIKTTKPTPRQVSEMKAANKAHNEGVLRDDVTGEVMVDSGKSRSGVKPPTNEAQVDHKQPASRGGTRELTNLELRTRKNNRDKWDKLPEEE